MVPLLNYRVFFFFFFFVYIAPAVAEALCKTTPVEGWGGNGMMKKGLSQTPNIFI